MAKAFQSTHPCGVRLDALAARVAALEVSIHAPLRGATLKVDSFELPPDVSIHAPLRGATTSGISS